MVESVWARSDEGVLRITESRGALVTVVRIQWKALSTHKRSVQECAGSFKGTWPTAAEFEFLLGTTGAGIVAPGLLRVRSRHGGRVSACFDSMVRDVAVRKKKRGEEFSSRFKEISLDGRQRRDLGLMLEPGRELKAG